MGFRRGVIGLATALALAAFAASAQGAAEITRDDYVARAEAICKEGVERTTPLMRTGLSELKENKVVSAGPKIVRAAELATKSRLRLLTVPKPPEDAVDLTAWLKRLKVQNFFLSQAGKALLEEHRVQAQGYLSRFSHNGNLANELVLGFGFKTCLFNPKVK